MRLFLFCAFPREVRQVVRMIGAREKIHGLPFRAFRVRLPSHSLIVAETGLGIENSEAVLLHLLQTGRPDAVISLGYCGALSDEASVGDLIWASRVCLIGGQGSESLILPDDWKLAERLSLKVPVRSGTFLTMQSWMKKGEASRFVTREMTLPVCDMETFGLARISLSRRLPFIAVRAVSDESHIDLAFDPKSVCDENGTYRLSRALRLFLARPGLLAHGMDLRRTSKKASRNLARAASALLAVL